ncbi:hypothetical protein FN846DRAFT_813765 [Sphaerosporella brunnea]|uniref:WD40-repeat-containing domain protein n=1 Tax=Sphaerosporella brunnea TaxID=1250544 RepID=A0A5J5EVK3_9PEZI|nr:hypothetical protein FN846DRAFT_813765 [Sphaerosporella brunnea]
MSRPAFSFPYSHWSPRALSLTTPAAVTTSRFIAPYLLLGLSSGEISIFTVSSPSNTPHLSARLLGHRSPIVALSPLETLSETSTVELQFLSLSSDGALSKWSLADFRCLQSALSTTSDRARPVGMVVVPRSGVGESRLTDSLVMVWGCNTEIVVLNAESLETVFVWSGHVDWPLPVAVETRGVGVGERRRECELLTMLRGGEVQRWFLTGKRERSEASVLAVRRDEDKNWRVELNEGWGRVRRWEKLRGGYLVVQARGIAFHVPNAVRDNGFVKKSEMAIADGIASVEVGTARKTVIVQTEAGGIRIFILRELGQLEEVATWPPPPFLSSERILNVAAFFDAEAGRGKLAVASRPKIQKAGERPGIDFSVADILRHESTIDIMNWNEKADGALSPALTNSTKLDDGSMPPEPSTCSEIFSNMLAIAHGTNVYLYSLTAFLLAYHEPNASIKLPCTNEAPICLLKRVHIKEYGGSYGGTEYLVAGTQVGDLYIIEAPSYSCLKRLPLFPTAVAAAHLLPSDLGRRLRSTLLVITTDGTASIVDIERGRVLVTFPSHEASRLTSFATKPGQNIVALTYQDGVCREWSMGEEEGGVLLNPPPSRGSGHSKEDSDGALSDEGGDTGEWRVIHWEDGGHHEEDGGETNSDGSIQLWDICCRVEIPTAGVNVRAIVAALETAMSTAAQRSREGEKRVIGNHPAIINAKSLLTALFPGGTLDLFLDYGNAEEDDDDEGDLGDWRFAVDQLFFRRKRPATLGLIGAANRVSMFTPTAFAEREDISPTATSIKLLAALTLITLLLEATGKKGYIDTVVEKMLQSHLGKRKVALGLFAKFWSDENPAIRWVARQCLDAFMSALTADERKVVVEYWRSYLPVDVPPELSSAKEVARSVILLGKLITDYDDNSYDSTIKKSVARSAELLLNEQNPLYQDTAIEVLGYSWTPFEKLLDAYSAIHSLLRIAASELPGPRRELLHRCFLEIARKNSPLLATSLANNIAHSAPEISAAAIRIVTAIVRQEKPVFADVLPTLIEAVVKTLDPSSGLRERVLPAISELVETLLAAYKTVAFHRPSQRLAVSKSPGLVIIYDLKAGSILHVLSGHKLLARHLVFDTDGRCVAAMEWEAGAEVTLLVWRLPGGFLSYLGTATTGESERLQPRVVKKLEVENGGNGLGEEVEVRWNAERKVEVLAGGVKVVEVAA